MINLEEGLVLSGRCTWGNFFGYITRINSRTYRVYWADGNETEQLRPDLEDDGDWNE